MKSTKLVTFFAVFAFANLSFAVNSTATSQAEVIDSFSVGGNAATVAKSAQGNSTRTIVSKKNGKQTVASFDSKGRLFSIFRDGVTAQLWYDTDPTKPVAITYTGNLSGTSKTLPYDGQKYVTGEEEDETNPEYWTPIIEFFYFQDMDSWSTPKPTCDQASCERLCDGAGMMSGVACGVLGAGGPIGMGAAAACGVAAVGVWNECRNRCVNRCK